MSSTPFEGTARPFYLALGTGQDTAGLLGEASGGGYARQAVTIAPCGSTALSADAVTFNGFTASLGTFTHAALFTEAAGGVCVWAGELAPAAEIVAGGAVAAKAGALVVAFAASVQNVPPDEPVPPPAPKLTCNRGFLDFRADNHALLAAPNAAVSVMRSDQGFFGYLEEGKSRFQPSHVAAENVVRFAGAVSTTDTLNGRRIGSPWEDGQLSRLLGSWPGPGQLGVVYLLFRCPNVPSWRTCLFSGGSRHNVWGDERNGVGLLVLPGGRLRAWRGDGGGASAVETLGSVRANEWTAAAFVFNDDRGSPGTPTNRARLIVKTKPGGAFATREALSTATPIGWPTAWDMPYAGLNGAIHEPSGGIGNWDLHSLAIDLSPPTTDQALESNLDALLARV